MNLLPFCKRSIGIKMCILKISTSGSKDSNPVTAKFQPSKILNRSIGHTYDGIDPSLVNGGHDVDTFMAAFPSIGSFVLPGIFKGDGVVRTIGGCSNRKIPEIIPYGTAEFQVFVPVRKVFPVWFVFLYRKSGRFIRMIQRGKTGTKSVRICLKPSLKPVETKKPAGIIRGCEDRKKLFRYRLTSKFIAFNGSRV